MTEQIKSGWAAAVSMFTDNSGMFFSCLLMVGLYLLADTHMERYLTHAEQVAAAELLLFQSIKTTREEGNRLTAEYVKAMQSINEGNTLRGENEERLAYVLAEILRVMASKENAPSPRLPQSVSPWLHPPGQGE